MTKSSIARYVLAILTSLGLTLALAAGAQAGTSKFVGSIPPAAGAELDCNGWSNAYSSLRPAQRELCTDPISISSTGKASRFNDNGWYVGHDEPSVKFISSAHGSGNTMTYFMTLPTDPSAAPTPSGSVSHYAELSPALWFGLPICDPHSYPQTPCKPDSDQNQGTAPNPASDAGSAFMELQFYAPGFTPWWDSPSCNGKRWCAALDIDSLECDVNGNCNGACIEPVNSAWIQRDGVPTGPPSPQRQNTQSIFPNAETLLMNSGDRLEVSISDPRDGLLTVVRDLTTGQTGFMQASHQNGFANTNIKDCSGNPFTFHAEYDTARQQNQVPWAALEGGVLMEQEMGHFESCNSLANHSPFSQTFPDGSTFLDPNTYQTCVGGLEGPNTIGEGPCTNGGTTCADATTQGPTGPVPCSTPDSTTAALCEFSDGYCRPAGTTQVLVNGSPMDVSWPVSGCEANQFQNGDLDFEGNPYQPEWPNGSPNTPTSAIYSGPFTNGRTYPQIQFETDVGGSSNLCNINTGAGCTVPPISAHFYPFWTLSQQSGGAGERDRAASDSRQSRQACTWNFGNVIPGQTANDFGGNAEYGAPNIARYGGTIISPVEPNPSLSQDCGV